jgi:signal transduction histidine kinase
VKSSSGADAAPVAGHVYLDTRRRLLYCLNDSARQLQAEGMPFTDSETTALSLCTLSGGLVSSSDLPLLRAWRDRRPCEARFLMTRANGVIQLVHWSAAPLRDTNDQVVAVVGSVAVRSPEPDWQSLAGLAHDLRSPLQALKLLVSMAQSEELTAEERQEVLTRIRSSTERALSVGSDLLEWCRGPALGGRRVQMEWFAIEPFLVALLEEQTAAARHKSLTVVQDLKAIRGWEMLTDRVRLGRLLANLLNNAVRYTASGQVTFRASWRDGAQAPAAAKQLSLGVIDTGRGISPEEQESIFQPFERGQMVQGDSSGGSGLGLAIVDRLVEELRLGLEVSSEHGRGSSFALLIPSSMLRDTSKGPSSPR